MKDQVVLIVGASGGIGAATARLFGKAGAKVVLAARNKEKAESVAKDINDNGGEAYVTQVDVTEMSSVVRMVNDIVEELGQIDVLVNAFGISIIKPLLDVNPEDAKTLFDTNMFGTFLVTQTVMRHMETAKKGTVVMFPGSLGKYVMKNSSLYSATKFALTGFTKALVEENKRTNIKFTLLHLGGVATGMYDSDLVDMKVKKDKMLQPEEAAKAVYYAATQPGDSVLNELTIQPGSHQMV
jgi:NADP-dependent 3-hydroxy acid dehydrogenase YdfG